MMVCIMIEPLQQELIIFSLALYLHILNHWLQYLTIICQTAAIAIYHFFFSNFD